MPSEVPAAPDGLLKLLAAVPDPRDRGGIRHGLAGAFTVALSAVVAGAKSLVAIAECAANAGPEGLAALGLAGTVPSESTIWRCLQRLALDRLDELIGTWMWLRTARKDAAGNLLHLPAGLCQHPGTVLAQMAVGATTNEIPMLTTLLDGISDIAGAVITADAVHCQRDTAAYITGRGGHYIFTVKNNQPNVRKRLKALPWQQIPVLNTSTAHDHGRTNTRALKATKTTEPSGFPA